MIYHNKLSSSKATIRRTETLSERHLLLVTKCVNTTLGKEAVILAIPENCIDRMTASYHSSIFGGHQESH